MPISRKRAAEKQRQFEKIIETKQMKSEAMTERAQRSVEARNAKKDDPAGTSQTTMECAAKIGETSGSKDESRKTKPKYSNVDTASTKIKTKDATTQTTEEQTMKDARNEGQIERVRSRTLSGRKRKAVIGYSARKLRASELAKAFKKQTSHCFWRPQPQNGVNGKQRVLNYCTPFSTIFAQMAAENLRKINQVLIANRGEIAIRVMRTARKMGIKTIAVYSDADTNSIHTRFADSAIRIGQSSPLKSYLRGEHILKVAKKMGADAIHPGYGFLSENANFAKLCANNNIIFMGPPPSAISDMGMKNKAKQIMIQAGVPVVQGYNGPDQSAENLLMEAKKLGFPVMIKAVCGGGGKGMRIAWGEKDFFELLESARSESQKAFGNADMIVEKYVQRPRHVEVQIFSDIHGNYVYLWERDCSIQRRHQKIIEEAPAPGLTFKTRHWLGKTAVDAARAVNYVGAGTVEFILDTADELFYFMEMNTRLQVEHPITEAITGIDLVEWQFRVAQGEKLPLSQEQIQLKGHAIEARVYAEDSINNFMPTAGTLEHLEFPQDSFIRVDSGVQEGDDVSVHYDPMIAKVITAGEDRDQAIRLLDQALERTHIGGLCNNIQFVRNCLQHPKFRQADLYTDFIPEHQEELLRNHDLKLLISQDALVEAAISDILLRAFDSFNVSSAAPNPFISLFYFRLNTFAKRTIRLGDRDIEVTIMGNDRFKIDNPNMEICVHQVNVSETSITKRPIVWFEIETLAEERRWKCKAVGLSNGIAVFGAGHRNWISPESEETLETEDLESTMDDGKARSQMPGTIEKIFVKEGNKVAKGQPLVALNAMKMEFLIRAPFNGVVTSINCSVGDNVPKDAVLVRLNKEN